MKPRNKVLIGTVLLLPGLALWLGPMIVEYGLLPILAAIAVAGTVIGGVVLIADGSYDLTHRRNQQRNPAGSDLENTLTG